MSDVLMETTVLVAQRSSLSPIARRAVEMVESGPTGYKLDTRRSFITMYRSGHCVERMTLTSDDWTMELVFHTGSADTRLVSLRNINPEGYISEHQLYSLNNWVAGWIDPWEQPSISRQGRENAGIALLEEYDTVESIYRDTETPAPAGIVDSIRWFIENGYLD